jgi:DNA-binding MarR family transcriptional regulator
MTALSLSREERIKAITDRFVSLMWIAKRHYAHWLQSFGLTHPQFFTLAALVGHKEACTMRDLTEVLFQDPPTTTGVIDRLVKMKLVERTRSETDRRVVLVQVTPAGVELFHRIKKEGMEQDLKIYEALSDEELANYEQLLKHLLWTFVSQHTSLQGADLDAEVEKLQQFKNDPIHYYKKLEKEKRVKI